MFSGKRDLRDSRLAAAIALRRAPTKSDVLANCVNDYERMLRCQTWADTARRSWYEARKATILMVLESDDARWDAYPSVRDRKHIGERLWADDPRNKDLAGQEQMYSRWTQTYALAWATHRAGERASG